LQEQERYGGASGGVNSSIRRFAVRLASIAAKVFSFTVMRWDFALILLFLGIAVPVLGRRRVCQLVQMPSTTKLDRISLYASTLAFQWIAAGVILWRTNAHGIRASQLGLTIPNAALAVSATVVLAALILLNQLMGLRRLVAQPEKVHGILPQLALKLFPQDDVERLAFFALVTTVALCEELIYRGFVQRVFQDWSRDSVVAAVVGSSVFFALAHLYQGRRGLISTLTIGLLFSTIRAWTGSLLPCVVAHFVADITVGMLAPGRLRASLAKRSFQIAENNGDTS
jgi:membrane protease YdiL (CAAX protease family)